MTSTQKNTSDNNPVFSNRFIDVCQSTVATHTEHQCKHKSLAYAQYNSAVQLIKKGAFFQ